MKTVEILKLINETLKTVTEKVYLDNAPTLQDITDKSQYPYVVYELASSNMEEFQENISLTIDIWDYNKESMQVETMCDSINNALNLLNEPTENNYPTFYFNSRQKIYDINIDFKRRQLQYTIQNYCIEDFNNDYK